MHPLAKADKAAFRPRRRSFLYALAGLILAACGSSSGDTSHNAPPPSAVIPTPPPQPAAPRIGLILPQTGQAGEVGKALEDAAELALFDLNATNIELLPADAGGSAATASGAAQNVIGGGSGVVIGPLGATSVKAAAIEARKRGVPLLGFSTDRSAAGSGVYLLGFMPDEQATAVIGYAASTGLSRFGALIPVGAYGDVVGSAFEVAVGANGGTVVGVEHYKSGSLQPTDNLRALLTPGPDGNLPIDALFVPDGGTALQQVLSTIASLGFDPHRIRLLGTNQWSDSRLGSDPLSLGGWYAGPEPERFERFAAHFQSTYGRRPPRMAAQAYDAMTLAVLLARQPGGFASASALLQGTDGFSGVDGLFRFRADGTPQHGLAILEVSAGGPRVIRPAPDSFGGQGF